MIKEVVRIMLKTISLATTVLGTLLIIANKGVFIDNGRLTNTSCYLILAVALFLFALLFRLEYNIRKGITDPSALPRFMRQD